MDKSENVIILYGSQTGNSQDLSERIWRKAKLLKLTAHLRSFDRFDFNKLNNPMVKLLCVCSTTGQGDLPDNMTKFWKIIMKKNMPSDIMQNVEFGVIGLGDSSYEKYNFIAKKLYKYYQVASLLLEIQQRIFKAVIFTLRALFFLFKPKQSIRFI